MLKTLLHEEQSYDCIVILEKIEMLLINYAQERNLKAFFIEQKMDLEL